MTETGGRAVAMLNPSHLGENLRENMDELGWNAPETSARLALRARRAFETAQRRVAPVYEHVPRVGGPWLGTGDHWMRMQGSYERLRATLAVGAKPRCRHPLMVL